VKEFVKIGQYFDKVMCRVRGLTFLAHLVRKSESRVAECLFAGLLGWTVLTAGLFGRG